MNYLPFLGRRSLIVLTFIFVLLAIRPVTSYVKADPGGSNEVDPKWTKSLPATLCAGSSSDTNCHRSSPALADLNGNGKLAIIVATNNGHVLAVRSDGVVYWDIDIAPYFGMKAGKQIINSSPAVADIDNDGQVEIVVGAGTTSQSVCTQGGMIVLEADGRVKKGWPVLADDWEIPPAGCRESIFATPALGDLDLDGDLEIVYGGFDKKIYALHHDGRFVAGFPPDSYHFQRFGWPNLKGRLGDVMWGSAALADLTGDGYLDVVIGTNEGNYDSRWQPVLDPWNCPYRPVRTPGYCGGSIYALDRNGKLLDGFPRYIHESIDSTPAVMDVNGDGKPEIFIGTGLYYHLRSADKPKDGFRLFGIDNHGRDLPGWEGGKVVGGVVSASPSIGDITGDGKPNIVVAARDSKLYAWHFDGRLVNGFPMTPKTHFNQVLSDYDVGTSFILADYTGDGKMEIFLTHAAEIIIVSGSGRQLTAPESKDTRPAYYTGARLWNNPAVGDLDGDGHLEMVVQNSKLFLWELPISSPAADWPLFMHDAARTSTAMPMVSVDPNEQSLVIQKGDSGTKEFFVSIYGRLGVFNWTISSDRPEFVSFTKNSGTIQGRENVLVRVNLPQNYPVGVHSLGNITVEVKQSGGADFKKTIPLKLKVVNELHRAYIPLLH